MVDGHNRLTFEIAGSVFALQSDQPNLSVSLADSFQPFLCSSEPEIVLTVAGSPFPAMIPLERHRLFEAWDRWALYRIEGREVLVERESFNSVIPQRVLIFDPVSNRGELYFRSDNEPLESGPAAPNPLEYPLGHVLMMCLLARRQGLMVHACGIDDQGRGYLFPGNSGHGKSTMACVWNGTGRILSDECIVLKERDGQFRMYGTPWHGSYNAVSPWGVPVEKIFFLGAGPDHRATPVRGAKAVAMMLARSYPPLWDSEAMALTLELLARLCEQASCYELAFLPDESVIQFVRCVK